MSPPPQPDAIALGDRLTSGELDPEAFRRALLGLRTPLEWRDWLDRLLLWVGTALFVAGVVFFFAYNWDDLGTFQRFGVIEVACVGAFLGSLALGLDSLGGSALLTAGCMGIGVFLAVFGQTYQTGADAWQLFAGWAALTVPFAAVSRSGATWTLLLVLVNLALVLFGAQVAEPAGWIQEVTLTGIAGGVSLLGLVLREAAHARGASWLAHPWTRWLYLGAGLSVLTVPSVYLVFETIERGSFAWVAREGPGWFVPFLLLAAALPLAYRDYRHRTPDLVALTLVVSSAAALVHAAAMGFVGELHLFGSSARFTTWMLLASGVTLATGIGVGKILHALAAALREEAIA